MERPYLDGLGFGLGLPKICIPITAADIAGLSTQLLLAENLPGDLYEWRLDHYSGDVELGLDMCRRMTPRPMLCTLRTRGQGGLLELSPEEYLRRIRELIGLGDRFRLIDIELAAGDEAVRELAAAAHERGLGVIVSQHSFTGTPGREEMVRTLLHMRDLGADLPKLAVTPAAPTDVFELMSASWEAYALIGPVVTMSMGPIGRLSRVAGSITGSCMTFGAGEAASAPGQLGVRELRQALEILGRGLDKE